jgi:hypothetical protein
MRRLLLIIAILFASVATAQEATLNTPIPGPSKDKYVVDRIVIDRVGPRVSIEVVVQNTAGTVDIERLTFNVPDTAHPSATVLLFLTALDTAIPGESGSSAKRANARVLDYVIDHGYLTGVTLVP